MDGDGSVDITVSNYLANSVSVYSNDGTGNSFDRRDWGVGVAPNNHAIADVNADGKLDIVAAASQTSQTTVNVVLNAGDRTYVARRDYGMAGAANGVDFADFNHDGYRDVVSGTSRTRTGLSFSSVSPMALFRMESRSRTGAITFLPTSRSAISMATDGLTL